MLDSSTGSLRSLAAARSDRSSESICSFETAEEPSKGGESGLAKHSDLWFTDGSVVLRAEDTTYRVHISQLSRHSIILYSFATYSLYHKVVQLARRMTTTTSTYSMDAHLCIYTTRPRTRATCLQPYTMARMSYHNNAKIARHEY